MFEKMKCLMYMDCWSSIFKLIKKKFILLKNIITKILSKNPLRLGKSLEFDLKLTLDNLKVLVSIYTDSCQHVLSIELINSDI